MDQFQTGAAAALSFQFDVGVVLGKTFSTLKRKPLLFIGLVVLAIMPQLIVGYSVSGRAVGTHLLVQFAGLMLALMIQGSIAYGAFQVMSQRNPTFADCILRGMGRIGAIFLASLLIILCTAAVALIVVFPAILLLGPLSSIGILIIIAAFMAMACMWLVTVPACAVEQLGPVQSMQRSISLTRGYRLQILALLILTSVAVYGLSFALGYVLTMAFRNLAAGTITATLLVCIPRAFQYVMFAIIYHDLRAAKEGVSVETLASVFE